MRRFDYLTLHKELTANIKIVRLACELSERNAEIRLLTKQQPRRAYSWEALARDHNIKYFWLAWNSCMTEDQQMTTHNELEFRESRWSLSDHKFRKFRHLLYGGGTPSKPSEWILCAYRDIQRTIYTRNGVKERGVKENSQLDEGELRAIDLHAETVNRCLNNGKGELAVMDEYMSLASIYHQVQYPESVTQMILRDMCEGFNEAVKGSAVPLFLIPAFLMDYGFVQTRLRGIRSMDHLPLMYLFERFGILCGRFSSLETAFRKKTDEEKKFFESDLSDWQSGEFDYEPYVEFLLDTILDVSRRLSERMQSVFAEERPPRDERIQERIKRLEEIIRNNREGISKDEILTAFPEIGLKTVERTLYAMLRENRIVRSFSGRTAIFRYNWENNSRDPEEKSGSDGSSNSGGKTR